MARFAVALMSYHENDMEIHIVEALDWHNAVEKVVPDVADWVPNFFSQDLEIVKDSFFDCDQLIDVVEI